MRKEFKPTSVFIPPDRVDEIDWHVEGANYRAKTSGAKLHKELETRSSFIRAAIEHYLRCRKGLLKIV